jgi:hypothetical protein
MMRRLGTRLAIAAAVLSPDGIQPEGSSNLPADAWAALRGGDGPYYLVRVSVGVTGEDSVARVAGERLLAALLLALRAHQLPASHGG